MTAPGRGRRPYPPEAAAREAEAARRKRRLRKEALLAVAGRTCSACPAPAWAFAAHDAGAYGVPSLSHAQGPSDRGLTSRAERIFADCSRRAPLCRQCLGRTVLARRRAAGSWPAAPAEGGLRRAS